MMLWAMNIERATDETVFPSRWMLTDALEKD